MRKALIVGAGITGATIARILADTNNFEVRVVEQKDKVGGACHDCFKQEAYYQSHGAHIFNTKNNSTWDFVSRFTDWHPFHHEVLGLVDGTYVPLPINLNSIEKLFSSSKVAEIEKTLKELNIEYDSELTLSSLMNNENKVLSDLGNFIYHKVFENYSMKQWEKMPNEAVINRVKAFRYSRDNRYFVTDFQGIPEQGYTEMIKNMLDHRNIKVELDSKISLADFKLLDFDYIFYCGPLDELMNYKYGQLEYRSCRFESFLYRGRYRQKAPVINYPNSYKFTRCHDYSYFIPECSNGYFVKEYPEKFELDNDVERYYPINDEKNNSLHAKYIEELKKDYPNVIPAGRLGSFKYFSMDKAIESAMELVEKEVGVK